MILELNEVDVLQRQIEFLANENARLEVRLSQQAAALQALAAAVEKLPEPKE